MAKINNMCLVCKQLRALSGNNIFESEELNNRLANVVLGGQDRLLTENDVCSPYLCNQCVAALDKIEILELLKGQFITNFSASPVLAPVTTPEPASGKSIKQEPDSPESPTSPEIANDFCKVSRPSPSLIPLSPIHENNYDQPVATALWSSVETKKNNQFIVHDRQLTSPPTENVSPPVSNGSTLALASDPSCFPLHQLTVNRDLSISPAVTAPTSRAENASTAAEFQPIIIACQTLTKEQDINNAESLADVSRRPTQVKSDDHVKTSVGLGARDELSSTNRILKHYGARVVHLNFRGDDQTEDRGHKDRLVTISNDSVASSSMQCQYNSKTIMCGRRNRRKNPVNCRPTVSSKDLIPIQPKPSIDSSILMVTNPLVVMQPSPTQPSSSDSTKHLLTNTVISNQSPKSSRYKIVINRGLVNVGHLQMPYKIFSPDGNSITAVQSIIANSPQTMLAPPEKDTVNKLTVPTTESNSLCEFGEQSIQTPLCPSSSASSSNSCVGNMFLTISAPGSSAPSVQESNKSTNTKNIIPLHQSKVASVSPSTTYIGDSSIYTQSLLSNSPVTSSSLLKMVASVSASTCTATDSIARTSESPPRKRLSPVITTAAVFPNAISGVAITSAILSPLKTGADSIVASTSKTCTNHSSIYTQSLLSKAPVTSSSFRSPLKMIASASASTYTLTDSIARTSESPPRKRSSPIITTAAISPTISGVAMTSTAILSSVNTGADSIVASTTTATDCVSNLVTTSITPVKMCSISTTSSSSPTSAVRHLPLSPTFSTITTPCRNKQGSNLNDPTKYNKHRPNVNGLTKDKNITIKTSQAGALYSPFKCTRGTALKFNQKLKRCRPLLPKPDIVAVQRLTDFTVHKCQQICPKETSAVKNAESQNAGESFNAEPESLVNPDVHSGTTVVLDDEKLTDVGTLIADQQQTTEDTKFVPQAIKIEKDDDPTDDGLELDADLPTIWLNPSGATLIHNDISKKLQNVSLLQARAGELTPIATVPFHNGLLQNVFCGTISCFLCLSSELNPSSFTSLETCEEHLKNVHSQCFWYTCTYCGAACPTAEEAEVHLKQAHSNNKNLCKNEPTDYARLHNDSGAQQSQCSSVLSLSEQLSIFLCGSCDATFDSHEDCFKHIDSHTQGYMHECSMCQRSFETSILLKSHQKSVHLIY